jgi:ribulose-phosphate 3-epimerase
MPQDTLRIAPLVLAANFARLGEQVAEAERCGADRIHVDVAAVKELKPR